MRLSADREDKSFHALAYEARVLFNDRFLNNVITADEERGFIVCYTLGLHGAPMACACGEHLMTEIRFGCVDILLPKRVN